MVEIPGPLSDEEMKDLAKRTPDTFLEQDDILYVPTEGSPTPSGMLLFAGVASSE
jgi:hypothetical protein